MPGTNAYNEPEGPVRYEEKIKRSIFIANLEPCRNEEEARNFLARITSEHHNANHNCRAYIFSDESEYYSDDGEPSGTAGRPILNAIKRSGLVNVMVIVTRYFGGIKLGVRGLIDAYGDTAFKALSMSGVRHCIRTERVKIVLGYASMGTVTRILNLSGASGLLWEYGENVSVIGDVPVSECECIVRELDELKARRIICEYYININGGE